jgi:hypothetical protein
MNKFIVYLVKLGLEMRSHLGNTLNVVSTQTEQRRTKMSTKLKDLVDRWASELGFRDGGAAATETYKQIKKIATSDELIEILETQFLHLPH